MGIFEDIRPYDDDEVPGVIHNLLLDKEFLDFLGSYHAPQISRLAPFLIRWLVRYSLKQKLGSVTSIADFQQVISEYAARIVHETMTSFDYAGIDKLDAKQAYLFVGNHRDIAGDSMLVDYALLLSGFDTVRIAVGDNLVQKGFSTVLMKLNKSFFVNRSAAGSKKVYAALLKSSQYIHQSIREQQSVWIAQSEGRAKDGRDITDPAIIKMFALAHRKLPLSEILAQLSIVPVSIAYEYDPCDYLKAKELQSIQTFGSYEKTQGEDLLNLVKGLSGFKGRVCLQFGDVLTGNYASPEAIAHAIDRQILDQYRLYEVNYWALAQLVERQQNNPITTTYPDTAYQEAWRTLGGNIQFSNTTRFQCRLNECPKAYQHKWLEIYANPVLNKFQAKSTHLTPI